MNDQDILTCAEQAAAWLLDRRERLEKHEHESATLVWSRLVKRTEPLPRPIGGR